MATVPYDIHALDDPFYRSSDGRPMSDNTEQYDWILAVQGGLDSIYRNEVSEFCGWVGPQLSIRFEMTQVLQIFGFDGHRAKLPQTQGMGQSRQRW